MKHFTKSLALVLTVFSLGNAFCQKELQQANSLYEKFAFADAITAFENALSKNPDSFDAQRKLAESYRLTGNYKAAEKWYSKVVENPQATSLEKFYFGQMLMNNGNYNEAKKWLTITEKEKPDDERVRHHLDAINYLAKFFADSISYAIENIPANGTGNDFSPAFVNGGLMFTGSETGRAKAQTHSWTGQSYTHLYFISSASNDAEPFAKEIKTQLNNGPATVFQNEMVTTLNIDQIKNKKADHFKLKLVLFKFDGKKWKKSGDLPFNNNQYNVAHPAFSKDGKKLYFSSDMPGGEGGMDLYVAERNGDIWEKPISLGNLINTPGNEMFPYADDDGNVFFASNGHEGLGGLDIFVTKPSGPGWSHPQALSYPINTTHDDFGFIIDREKIKGYFASNRPGGKGGDDIYSFTFTRSSLHGVVKNKDTNNSLANASITITEKSTGEKMTTKSNDSGDFSVPVNPCQEYDILVHSDDYRYPSTQTFRSSCTAPGIQKTEILFANPRLTVSVKHKYTGEKLAEADLQVVDTETNTVVAKGKPHEVSAVVQACRNYDIVASGVGFPTERKNHKTSCVAEDETIELQVGLPPEDPNLIAGTVFEQGTTKPLDSAAIMAYDGNNRILGSFTSAVDGTFVIPGIKNASRLVIFRNGYFSQTKLLANEKNRKAIAAELPRLALDKIIQLEGIFYDLGKFAIRPDASRVLDNLVKVMEENPTLNVELSAHTDSRGKDETNLALSDKRAKAAAAYVVSKGIAETRIAGKGYGESQLKNRCGNGVKCSENEHQQNRRTEVKVTGY